MNLIDILESRRLVEMEDDDYDAEEEAHKQQVIIEKILKNLPALVQKVVSNIDEENVSDFTFDVLSSPHADKKGLEFLEAVAKYLGFDTKKAMKDTTFKFFNEELGLSRGEAHYIVDLRWS